MIIRALPLIISLLLLGCRQDRKSDPDPLDYIPDTHIALLKINNLTAFSSDLKNNHFLNSWKKTGPYGRVVEHLAPLRPLQSNAQALIAFYGDKDTAVEYLLVAPFAPGIFDPEDAGDLSREALNYKGQALDKYTLDGQVLYGMVRDSLLLLSTSDSLLHVAQSVPGRAGVDPRLASLYTTANPDRNATLFIRLGPAANAFPALLQPPSENKLTRFSDWISLDINSQQDYLSFSGIALPEDSIPNYVDLFGDAGPLPLATPSYTPETALGIIAYAVGDYQEFSVRKAAYTGGQAARDSLFHSVEEIGLILDKAGKLVLLNTYGADTLSQYLREQSTGSDNYQEHEIYSFPETSLLTEHIGGLVGDFNAGYFTVLGNALIFAEQKEPLLGLVNHYNLGTTFDKTPMFTSAKKSLADEANLLLVTGDKGFKQLLDGVLGDVVSEDLKKTDLSEYSISAQLVAGGGFYHTTLMLKRLGAESDDRPTAPWYTVQLDAPLATDPQLVINHRNHRKEIVVQDEDNNLYLIGTEGKVLWKKPLGGRIQGRVAQVDLYKNGRLQLAFTTDNQFMVLDRNGKQVPPFTMKFPGGNLNPLAVFDYDNNRNYRFVVTQGTDVHMYDRQGKVVRGFTYTKAESPILPSPQHIRFGNRDYLIFRLEDGSLKILNRVGQTRVRVEEKIDFSENDVYAYQNQFALTDKKGTLYKVNEQGKITKTAFGLNQDHGLEATSKSLAYMNENVLSIKGKEVRLDYGVYTAPRIFYIYDKIYVSVTDLQSQRTYLFDSQAKPIGGFPVSGSSVTDLGDMDNDRRLELVTRLQDNSLVVYRIK